jgi:DNA helicase IV
VAGRRRARYDFLVVDEVQDLTNAELTFALRTLEQPGQFVLCGDANQIVHPNVFSWSRLKSLFFRDEDLAAGRRIGVLEANYRNARAVTRTANLLLGAVLDLRAGASPVVARATRRVPAQPGARHP